MMVDCGCEGEIQGVQQIGLEERMQIGHVELVVWYRGETGWLGAVMWAVLGKGMVVESTTPSLDMKAGLMTMRHNWSDHPLCLDDSRSHDPCHNRVKMRSAARTVDEDP
ncbi:hypothetical protein E3N88_44791 [Mikania micrantha]|uniref:Uncharacterized protein n=1 Tax=Mikania micrantha TaxID=192012 RepID=A0A5N6LB05_9ASTR|nr:hypothetical protein E3N88_44791 [Mikania micrantha]